MKNFLWLVPIVIAVSLLVFPMATARAIELVPCATTAHPETCTLCHLVIGFHNLVTFFRNILITIALAGIFFSGLLYVISAGSEGLITQAKAFLRASLIGFAVVLGAWLIVNVTMQLLSAKSDLGIEIRNWNEFECKQKPLVTAELKTSCNEKELGGCGPNAVTENLTQTGDYTATWTCKIYDEAGKVLAKADCSYSMAWCGNSECKCLNGDPANCSADKKSWTCKTTNEEKSCPQ